MSHRHAAAAATLLSFTLGCSSTYMPRPSSRASIVMDEGTMAYVRDGKKYDGGIFGGHIEEAVRGNPQAEDYAHQFKTGMITGFVLSTIGIIGVIVGATLVGVQASQQPNDQSVPVTGLVVMGGGLLVDIIGSSVMLNAQPHLFDAINAYNDGIPAPAAPPTVPAPAAPPAVPAPAAPVPPQ
jgi:hypothetical protein